MLITFPPLTKTFERSYSCWIKVTQKNKTERWFLTAQELLDFATRRDTLVSVQLVNLWRHSRPRAGSSRAAERRKDTSAIHLYKQGDYSAKHLRLKFQILSSLEPSLGGLKPFRRSSHAGSTARIVWLDKSADTLGVVTVCNVSLYK